MTGRSAEEQSTDRTPGSAARVSHPWTDVGRVDEIPPGQRKILTVDGLSVGVFNVRGHFVAILNICPHAMGPVCRGRISGTTLPSAPGTFQWARDGEILRCPWHGWEFDIHTGRSVAGLRHRLRLYPTEVRRGRVFVRTK